MSNFNSVDGYVIAIRIKVGSGYFCWPGIIQPPLHYYSAWFIQWFYQYVCLTALFMEACLCQSQKVLSLTNIPFFGVIFPCLLIPCIFWVEKRGLLFLKYSIIWLSTSIPEISWKDTPFRPVPKTTSNRNFGVVQAVLCCLSSLPGGIIYF